MARPLRIDFPNSLHHIFSRGNMKEDIFKDSDDRLKFLDFLLETRNRYMVKIYAYCLMDNHFHLLIESGPTHIGNFMRDLLTNYVQYFNRKQKRIGHLMQDRYKSILVDKESYLYMLIKYIHLNPVRGGLCESPDDYLWSSHMEYLGERKGIVEVDFVIKYFKGLKNYRNFINDGNVDLPDERRFKNYMFYGNDKFINNALDKISMQRRELGAERSKIKFDEIKRFVESRFSCNMKNLNLYKDMEIKRFTVVLLRDRLHYTLKKIASILGIHFTGVAYLYKTASKGEILDEFDKSL